MYFEPWRQEMATRSLVLPEQFEIDENGITHKPTGWKFIPYPGDLITGPSSRAQWATGSKRAKTFARTMSERWLSGFG
jgi:hypothetical protein